MRCPIVIMSRTANLTATHTHPQHFHPSVHSSHLHPLQDLRNISEVLYTIPNSARLAPLLSPALREEELGKSRRSVDVFRTSRSPETLYTISVFQAGIRETRTVHPDDSFNFDSLFAPVPFRHFSFIDQGWKRFKVDIGMQGELSESTDV